MTTATKLEFRAPSHIADSAAQPAVVSPTPLLGTWINLNPATRDIVKIVIEDPASLKVNVFGACTPTFCNWGIVPALAYAANVSATPADAFSAHYSFGFAQVIVVGHLHGRELILETFTQFTDGSGRSNLYTTDTMKK
jgi:hypothetical protein